MWKTKASLAKQVLFCCFISEGEKAVINVWHFFEQPVHALCSSQSDVFFFIFVANPWKITLGFLEMLLHYYLWMFNNPGEDFCK